MNKKTFRDFLNDDLNVFFNLNEFAEDHELDGVVVPLVVVETQSNDHVNGFPREQLYAAQEVFKQLKTIYVKSTDYFVPKVDSVITLDNEEYYVDDASEEHGVIRIVVSANES